ncbi:hypothetical protein R3W88_008014 [Solanum pinnatisectum]|uniref:RNase H type-1 domain-containing protein n=1 Tax=Solanum pinnatisectum TaxID=50273 RepID=A0AAV9M7G1_9SOLN|nr:hypothetical protein R3W88_008014 [Solanum pinnatisectum]
MVLAFATPLGDGTSIQAEVEAARFGLSWSLEMGYKNIILESDSQLLVAWIMNRAQHPWSIDNQLRKLQQLIGQIKQFKCNHIYREANCAADSLSKHSHKITSPQVYFNSQQLPKETKAYHQLDMQEVTNFRRRKTKRIKEPP